MAGPSLPFLIPIRAIDAVTSPMRRIMGALTGSRMMGALGRLNSGLGLVRQWTQRAVLGFSAMAVAGVGALFAIAKATSSRGDEIAKLAKQIGISGEALQEFQFVGERSGVAQEALNSSLAGFSKRLGEAKAGTGSLATFLKRVSPALLAQVTATDSVEESLLLYLDAIKSVEDPTKRAALAAAAFGRSGAMMVNVAAEGADGIAALRTEARDLGGVMGEEALRDSEAFNDSLFDMQFGLLGLRNTIGNEVMPRFTQWMRQLLEVWKVHLPMVKDQVKQAGAWLATAFEWGRAKAAELWPEVLKVTSKIGELLAWVDKGAVAVGGWGTVLQGLAFVVGGVLVTAFGAWAVAVIAATWPILAIGAVIGIAAYLVWKYWAEIKEAFSASFNFISDVISGFADVVGGVWDWLKEKVLSFVDWLPDFSSLIPDWVRDLMGGDESKLSVDSERRQVLEATGAALEERRTLDQQARVSVEFKNIPAGAAIKAKKTPGMDFDLDTGYSAPGLAGGGV